MIFILVLFISSYFFYYSTVYGVFHFHSQTNRYPVKSYVENEKQMKDHKAYCITCLYDTFMEIFPMLGFYMAFNHFIFKEFIRQLIPQGHNLFWIQVSYGIQNNIKPYGTLGALKVILNQSSATGKFYIARITIFYILSAILEWCTLWSSWHCEIPRSDPMKGSRI